MAADSGVDGVIGQMVEPCSLHWSDVIVDPTQVPVDELSDAQVTQPARRDCGFGKCLQDLVRLGFRAVHSHRSSSGPSASTGPVADHELPYVRADLPLHRRRHASRRGGRSQGSAMDGFVAGEFSIGREKFNAGIPGEDRAREHPRRPASSKPSTSADNAAADHRARGGRRVPASGRRGRFLGRRGLASNDTWARSPPSIRTSTSRRLRRANRDTRAAGRVRGNDLRARRRASLSGSTSAGSRFNGP